MTLREFVAPIAIVAVGAAAFGLIDGAVGLLEPGLELRGGAEHALYFLLCAGQALLAGIPAAIGVAIVLGLLAKPRFGSAGGPTRGFSPGLVVLAVAAAVACEVLNAGLFRGAGVRARSWQPAAEWTFRILAGPALVAAILGSARALRAPRPRGPGAALMLLAALLLVVNRYYRQQYPAIHLQLAVLALAASVGGAWGLLRGSRLDPFRRGPALGGILVAAVAVAAASVHAARVPELALATTRAEAAFATRAFGVTQFEPAIRRVAGVAGRPRPGPVATVDVSAILREVAPQIDGRQGGASEVGKASRRADLQAALDRAAPGRRSWNVLWIALDTVRADHVSHLGYSRKTTPVLDELARDAFVFKNAYTAYPTSNYGFCAALTSLAARANPVFGRQFDAAARYHDLQTLPSLLAKNGRATAAVTAFNRADLDDPVFFRELKEGFQIFNPDQCDEAADAPAITRSARGLLGGRLADPARPFFFWVHYLDAHDPYVRHAGIDFGPESIDRYDGEIAYADRHAGEVIDALERSGRLQNTVVVAFADHGEEFNEHGGRYHNGSLYDEQIHVPLLIKVPGMKGRTVESAVSLLDLVPTMADLLGVDDPAPRHGRSLAPVMLGRDDRGIAYSEVFVGGSTVAARNVRAIVVGDQKLIHRVEENRFEMYDLGRDPRERDSLAGQGHPDEAALRSVLQRWNEVIDARPEGAAAEPPLAARIEDLLAKLTDSSREVAVAAVEALEELFLAGYGPDPMVLGSLSPAELDRAFDTMARVQPKTCATVTNRLVHILCERTNPAYAPLFRGLLEDTTQSGDTRFRSALALAMIDDPACLPILRYAATSEILPDKSDVAWAYVRLGDPALLDWYQADLNGRRWGLTLRQAFAALPQFEKLIANLPEYAGVTGGRAVRDRIFEETSRHDDVNRTLVEALRGKTDEDSLLILFRLLRSDDEPVRDAAAAALKEVVTPADLDKGRAAMDDELDADSAAANSDWELAEAGYRAALAKGPLKNVGARLRLATALHAAGRPVAASLELEEAEKLASTALDRRLARRRLDQLRWPRFGDPARWSCKVLGAKFSEPAEGMPFGVVFKLENDGTEPWWGGSNADSVRLRLRFVDDAGAVVERPTDEYFLNHLREEGVNPGEEVEVLVVGLGPEPGERRRLSLSFANRRMQYPNGGIVWTEARPGTAPSIGPAKR